jgi:sugar lactone lactonase YvrE
VCVVASLLVSCANTDNHAPQKMSGTAGSAGGTGGAPATTGAAGTTGGVAGTSGVTGTAGTVSVGGSTGASGTSGAAGSAGGAAGSGIVVGRPGTGYLWYAGFGLNAFTQANVASSNNDGPAVTVVPTVTTATFHDLVFDEMGRLWTIPTSGNQILRFPASGLMAGQSPTAELALSSAALMGPQALAFDPSGNLWVLNFAGGGPSIASLVRFDGVQSMSGILTVSPAVTITPAGDATSQSRFSEGTALAFDSSGNLWFAGVSDVLRIDRPISLTGSVTAAPTAVVSTGEAYTSIAFDAGGALWITGTLQGYFAIRIDSPSTIMGVVTPKPAARIGLPVTTGVAFVGGLAFDSDRALWVATSNRILKLATPNEFSGEVTGIPKVTLGLPPAVMPGLASKLVFQPKPAGVPIY